LEFIIVILPFIFDYKLHISNSGAMTGSRERRGAIPVKAGELWEGNMAQKKSFDMAEEFGDLDFHSIRIVVWR
jgi:hypothetical protein